MSKKIFEVGHVQDHAALEAHLNGLFERERIPIRHGIIPIGTRGAVYVISVPVNFATDPENDTLGIDPTVISFMKKKPPGGGGGAYN